MKKKVGKLLLRRETVAPLGTLLGTEGAGPLTQTCVSVGSNCVTNSPASKCICLTFQREVCGQ